MGNNNVVPPKDMLSDSAFSPQIVSIAKPVKNDMFNKSMKFDTTNANKSSVVSPVSPVSSAYASTAKMLSDTSVGYKRIVSKLSDTSKPFSLDALKPQVPRASSPSQLGGCEDTEIDVHFITLQDGGKKMYDDRKMHGGMDIMSESSILVELNDIQTGGNGTDSDFDSNKLLQAIMQLGGAADDYDDDSDDNSESDNKIIDSESDKTPSTSSYEPKKDYGKKNDKHEKNDKNKSKHEKVKEKEKEKEKVKVKEHKKKKHHEDSDSFDDSSSSSSDSSEFSDSSSSDEFNQLSSPINFTNLAIQMQKNNAASDSNIDYASDVYVMSDHDSTVNNINLRSFTNPLKERR